MKKMILFLIGLIPLLLGFLMDSRLMQVQSNFPFKLIGIIFLGLWMFLGFKNYDFEGSPFKTSLIVHLPALIVLLAIVYQEFIVGEFSKDILGMATQLFYLPLASLSSSIITNFFSFTPWTMQVFLSSAISFLLMFICFYLGCYFKKHRRV